MKISTSEHPAQSLDTGVTNSVYMLMGKHPNSHSILLLCQMLQLFKFISVTFMNTTLEHNPMSSKIHLYQVRTFCWLRYGQIKSQRVPFTTSDIFYQIIFTIFPPILFKHTPEFIEDALLPTLTKLCYVFKTARWQADTQWWLTGSKKVVNLKQHQNVTLGHGQRKRTTARDTVLF